MKALLAFLQYFFTAIVQWVKSIVFFFIPARFRFKDISKDVVLITGGGSGLGRLLAERFSRQKAKVVLWDINASGLTETKSLLKSKGLSCSTYIVDVSNREAVYSSAKKVTTEVGQVTILVNNAGIVSGRQFMQLKDENIIKSFEVNTLAHFWTLKAFYPSMVKRNSGHIVCISSVAGLGGSPSLCDYSATKFAVVGLQESLWLETHMNGHFNIHFTTVCPFFMNTGMFEGVQSKVLPIIEPSYAADQILKAVLTNQEFLIIPRVFYFLYPLRSLLPTKTSEALYEAFGTSSMLTNFVARKKD